MTLDKEVERLAEEIKVLEQFVTPDGVLPDKYCHWMLSARTQRISEINNGQGLSGTKGFELKGCYQCTLGQPKCEAYQQ